MTVTEKKLFVVVSNDCNGVEARTFVSTVDIPSAITSWGVLYQDHTLLTVEVVAPLPHLQHTFLDVLNV